MRMNEIMASTVREWVTERQAKGVSPATIQKVRFILSAIFTAALNDVTYLHPCKGVKTPTVPKKPLKIITSPLAAFAGLSVGLLVVKMTRQLAAGRHAHAGAATHSRRGAHAPSGRCGRNRGQRLTLNWRFWRLLAGHDEPDRLPAIRPLTCNYLVAGAG